MTRKTCVKEYNLDFETVKLSVRRFIEDGSSKVNLSPRVTDEKWTLTRAN